MSFALSPTLPGLTDREAVADTLYRAVLSFDLADETLLSSAMTDDVEFAMAGLSLKGIPELKAAVFDRVSKLDTTHFISNLRVVVESPTTARATCSAQAQHARTGMGRDPGPHRYMSGALYACELVKVGDLWKIAKWTANIVWTDGNRDVMAGE